MINSPLTVATVSPLTVVSYMVKPGIPPNVGLFYALQTRNSRWLNQRVESPENGR